jgi:fermentation-respiration switch protein FrsA (DUF1100 family)
MINQKITFKNKHDQKIVGIIDKPNSSTKNPMIIICHGFKGCKEEAILADTAKKLVDSGFATLRFDFTNGIGESEGLMEDITVGHYVEDLNCVIGYAEELDFVDKDKIGIAGHSLGGMACLLEASKDKRVKCLVSFSGVFNFSIVRKLSAEKEGFTLGDWKKQGFAKFHSYSKNLDVKVKYKFYEEGISYDMESAVKKIDCPILVIQGSEDNSVPIKQGEEIYGHANEPKQLRIIRKADHQFSNDNLRKEAVDSATVWFKKYLG